RRLINRVKPKDSKLGLRIGLHCGPLVAGVIGERKFMYDLWGETVNIASRMESQGVEGQIQVTERVREALADQFNFNHRGPIEVRGVGTLDVWFLDDRISPEHQDVPTPVLSRRQNMQRAIAG
ncbi:MAG: adenylate/guanylate cyclase domain-containing protein, partial [Pseudomonadota bacterium]